MKCKKCGVSISKKPLYRNNEVGVSGEWYCYDCVDVEPDKDTKKLVDILHYGKPQKAGRG